MNRKQRRALGRSGAGSAPGLPSDSIARAFAAAVADHRAGKLAAAERHYRHVLELAPDHADAQSRLGALLMTRGEIAAAIVEIKRALAIKPDLFEALGNLAQAYLATGQLEPAIHAAARALAVRETQQGKALLAMCCKTARFSSDNDGRMRKLMLRALTEGWARPRELTTVCVSLIKLDAAVNACMRRAAAAWPARLTADELFGTAGPAALAKDQLLARLLERDPLTDVDLERLLAGVRTVMLTLALAEATVEPDDLAFYSAVARQCFINEYIYSLSADEAAQARDLQSAMSDRLKRGEPVPPLWIAAAGAYDALDVSPAGDLIRQGQWPACIEAVIVQQINNPAEERRISQSIAALTAIDDEVSRAVRGQYEENPYPRWVNSAAPGKPIVLDDRPAERGMDVLVAGCGTGLSTIEFGRQAPKARFLAVDLSLASLSYAKRIARELNLANVEFCQADILNLAAIGRQFDFIDASGVLHHMADPWRGWQVLLSLLRPGGTMQVGLYSATARRNVVAARALIAERGYTPTPEGIRRCREDIFASDNALLTSLQNGADLFSTSECRDLLFHVQEHRITLPEIEAFIAANDLIFAGFNLDTATLQKFAARFPGQTASTDLGRWHAFETGAPDTFAGMYQFQVKKAAGSPQQSP